MFSRAICLSVVGGGIVSQCNRRFCVNIQPHTWEINRNRIVLNFTYNLIYCYQLGGDGNPIQIQESIYFSGINIISFVTYCLYAMFSCETCTKHIIYPNI